MNEQGRDFDDRMARMAQMNEVFVDQIRQLAELHKDGILTDEEFTAKKQEILARF